MNFIFDNDRPIYVQIIEQIKLNIVSEQLPAGSRLPSVRDLALQIQVNPNTLQKALAELEVEGLIYTERTNGKYVTADKALILELKEKLAKEKVKTFLQDMEKLGINKKESLNYLQKIEEEE